MVCDVCRMTMTCTVDESGTISEATPSASASNVAQTTPVATCRPTLKGKRRQQDDELTTIAKQCLHEIKNMGNDGDVGVVQDDDGKYGEYIATEMRKISNEITKQLVKAEIQSIFLKAHLGQLNTTDQMYQQEPVPPVYRGWHATSTTAANPVSVESHTDSEKQSSAAGIHETGEQSTGSYLNMLGYSYY